MVKIPIEKKLKKKIHRQIALAQDILIVQFYHFFPKAVLHGGTAIWRCFGGNRFSEDLDFYLPSTNSRFDDLIKSLEELGLEKIKFKKTKNAIYSKFRHQEATIRLEILFKRAKFFQTLPYEMLDGSFFMVNVLSKKELLKEKINSYLQRKLVRDLYDIFFLLHNLDPKEIPKKEIKKLIQNYSSPIDENNLKTLIIVGAVPKATEMIKEIQKWAK
ncbi:nucleotidyl transferase AbiEii/AbiGii toxin family protein [bacterium]|nr:nucleotidyl transferase AbiEii/AbiGii toxin family protein [bacterium]